MSSPAALPLEQRVQYIRSLYAGFTPAPKPDEVLRIPSRDEGRTIPIHVYRPDDWNATTPGPVLVNFHGSGFILHLHGADDEFARYVTQRTNFTVLDVGYRLGPENPFPSAPHDAQDAIDWVLSRPQQFDLSQIALSGFSAGANLVLGASSHLYPLGTFKHVIAFYPPTDLETVPAAKTAPSPTEDSDDAWIPNTFDEAYIPNGVDKKGPLLSPTYTAADQFPNSLLFVTAAQDILAHEAEALAEKIRAQRG
ncbi:hypothetical protein N0V84_009558 [Fusarium piperis]|uniref:Alpha/beta hydrolase fold-3 domain-containing protein n=1 Tax=Fusarium piperis TaxID=1435070 RepID=A0A9W8W622_9HYPO|nr:hypothetical protein N0V84_009558 [Fusarium piperis]